MSFEGLMSRQRLYLDEMGLERREQILESFLLSDTEGLPSEVVAADRSFFMAVSKQRRTWQENKIYQSIAVSNACWRIRNA